MQASSCPSTSACTLNSPLWNAPQPLTQPWLRPPPLLPFEARGAQHFSASRGLSAAQEEDRHPPVCEADELGSSATAHRLAAAKEGDRGSQRRKGKSWDYIVRSGIAGGVAGCVVRNTEELPLALLASIVQCMLIRANVTLTF